MDIRKIEGEPEIAAASSLAEREHRLLRGSLPYLPARSAADFAGRIAWVAREGIVLGLFEEGGLAAFLGGFVLEDFRNAGPGAYCPDWCHGADPLAWGDAAASGAAFGAYRALYRELAPIWRFGGASIHAVSAYATDSPCLEALAMTGFGRIMMDASRPAAELSAALREGRSEPSGAAIRRAEPCDAAALARLDAGLASHIATSPVLMPRPRGRDEALWLRWLEEPTAVAFVAADADGPFGFMKAEEPQLDVSYAVHGEGTLAIDGLFVEPARRGRGIGRALLAAMADHARETGRGLVSVDCETMNPEAYGFWSKSFAPLSFGLERRT